MDEFRERIRVWLAENLDPALRGLGGPGREHEAFEERRAWERRLHDAGWSGVGWPRRHGGLGATFAEQVAFHEEYARAGAPARVSHLGQELLGPALIEFGTAEQQRRFLPKILSVDELWCQGYSEPGAGSDLAAVRTSARREGDEWVVDGQKVWTSLAHVADWCFALVRTEPRSDRHHGLSFLLVPMRQDGVEVRPIRQLTGMAEFTEVFFTEARTTEIVGEPGDGWRIAMAVLGFERGVATLGQQVGFRRELEAITELAEKSGAAGDPHVAEALAMAWVGLEVMHAHAVRTLHDPHSASVAKLVWAGWHRRLGELAMLVRGAAGLVAPGDFDRWQRLFLFSRADTIYGGSDEIQRTVIAERVLGLPREARP